MITKGDMLWSFIKFSSIKEMYQIGLENLYVEIGVWRVNCVTQFYWDFLLMLIQWSACKLPVAWALNPLSPKIHIQILQTDLETFPWRIFERIWFKIKAFSLGNQFSYSHDLYSWWSADVVRRKLMLVTL